MITVNDFTTKSEDLLSSVLGLAIHFIKNLNFDRKNLQQLYSVCLYSRILELATGCKALLEKNTLVGIPILLRSIFESDIDLTNIMKCKDYPIRMYASFLEEKLRLAKEAASIRSNPYLDAARLKLDTTKVLKATQAKLDRLKVEKKGPISIRCRAEFAGKLNEYLTIYNQLCLDTHNNISSLEDWHLEMKSTDDYNTVVFKMAKADIIPELTTIPNILLFQTKAVAEFLETTGIEFDKYFQESKELDNMAEELAGNYRDGTPKSRNKIDGFEY